MTFVLICTCHSFVFAQYSADNFIRYTSRDGLSDNYVSSIQQDSFGFIWIGTENGLNRFDGYSFKNYFFDYPARFLASSKIRKLKLFARNELGIVSNGGFQILDPITMQIRNFLIPDSTKLVALRNAATDAIKISKNKYAITTAAGFYVFNANGEIDFRFDAYDLDKSGIHPVRYGRQLFQPNEDILIYHESRGLAHYSTERNTYTKVDSTNNKWNLFMHPVSKDAIHWITKAQIGPDEFVFLSAGDSLIYYHAGNRHRMASPLPFHWTNDFAWSSQIIPINDTTLVITGAYGGFYFLGLNRSTGEIGMDSNKYLPKYTILSVFKDRGNRYWFGTTTGLLRQIINEPLIEKFSWPNPSDRSDGYTDAIIHDSILYLSRQDYKSGLLAIDLSSMQMLDEFDFGEDLLNIVYSMEMYHPDTIWLATAEEMLWFDTESWTHGTVIHESSPDKHLHFTYLPPLDASGSAWMIMELGGTIGRYDPKTRKLVFINEQSYPPIPYNMIKHVAYDSFGDVWIGGHSLAKWDRDRMEFDTVINVYSGAHKYNEDILTMVADSAGSLWLHNVENGLLKYNILEKSYRQLSMKDGLPSNGIVALSPVVNDFLFLMTPHHLVRLNTKNFGVEIFGNENDLPEETSMAKYMHYDAVGEKMYAFYKDEIIRFPLDRSSAGNENNDIILQEMEINHEQKIFYPPDNIRLKHNENTLALFYTIIDFEQSHDYQFAYNLNNAKEWTAVGSQRVIHLTNLQPGEHHLKLRATGKSGSQKLSEFNFTIQRPFWNQAWFFPTLALLISTLVYLIFKARENRIREKANLDNQIAIAEMKALHAQMNPHFIFNSLNSIKEMVLHSDIKGASRYLSDFAHLIRMTLDQSRTTFISLRSTMEYINAYVHMEQIRTSTFTFQMKSDPALDPDETLIPPMLIQPFIENAIWHGSNGHQDTISIQVLFKKLNGHLVCTIEDDGIGIDRGVEKKNGYNPKHKSVSINNIQRRIDLLNQKHHFNSRIEITDKHNYGNGASTGTIVTITLPLEIEEAI